MKVFQVQYSKIPLFSVVNTKVFGLLQMKKQQIITKVIPIYPQGIRDGHRVNSSPKTVNVRSPKFPILHQPWVSALNTMAVLLIDGEILRYLEEAVNKGEVE